MKYIDSLREGMRISEVYLCKSKQIAQTKAGKDYGNLVLQDKTGTIDSKIWDLGSPGICNFEAMDYVAVDADVTMFQGNNQLNIRRIRQGIGIHLHAFPTGHGAKQGHHHCRRGSQTGAWRCIAL